MLEKHQRIQTFYVVILIIWYITILPVQYSFFPEFTSSPLYGQYQLIYACLAFVVFFSAHVYILDMFVNMQRLLRKYGHVKGNWREIFIFTVYFFYFMGYVLWPNLLRPILVFKINNQDFKCTEHESVA